MWSGEGAVGELGFESRLRHRHQGLKARRPQRRGSMWIRGWHGAEGLRELAEGGRRA